MIQPADAADADELTAIAHAAKRYWGYPASWMEQWREALTITEALVEQALVVKAMDGGRIVGFYALDGAHGRLILEHLWVRPDAMGQGIGRRLFQHAAEQARLRGAWAIVIESDPNATGFYRRMGAVPIGQTIGRLDGRSRVLPLLVLRLDQPGHNAALVSMPLENDLDAHE
jgi:predicted N-acetyltransferase YhbS